jgi:hypothetical protein
MKKWHPDGISFAACDLQAHFGGSHWVMGLVIKLHLIQPDEAQQPEETEAL